VVRNSESAWTFILNPPPKITLIFAPSLVLRTLSALRGPS
jgi:hypothetical protein